jgi:hypothetical protein
VVSSTRAYISALNKMISWAAEASAGECGQDLGGMPCSLVVLHK